MHHAHIDKFAYLDSPIHSLDSRVKFIAVIVYTFLVISLPPARFSILMCYAIGPFVMLVIGKIPLRFAFKQVIMVSPFILVLALSCPFYDRSLMEVAFGPYNWNMSCGWIRCFTILGKFTVTMLALIALTSTTRFSDLLTGMQRLGMPKLLIVQLGFLYRYIFVLIDKAHHIIQARSGRCLRNLGFKQELKTAGSMAGSLLVRSIDSAEKISIAMQARGFKGTWRSLSVGKLQRHDLYFAVTVATYIIILHFVIRPVLL